MNRRTIQWFKYAAPENLHRLAGRLMPWFAVPAAGLFGMGLYLGLLVAPADFQQGDAYRVLFIHVPAAWMGMLLYVVLAFYATVGWVLNVRASSMMASSLSATGAMFTVIALVTGSLWGRPTWGTWWVWDARTTSTLILLFLYVGFMSLQSAIDEVRRADRAGAVLALVGAVNVPIIYFSVEWWNTLHQGATLRIADESRMHASMLTPLLVMIAACWLYSIAVVLGRLQCVIRERASSGVHMEAAR
jgi:heme exporter protein C